MQNAATIRSEVEQRLLNARSADHECMLALIRERGDDADYSKDATRQMFRSIRRIASIDAARHGRDFSALSPEELAWLFGCQLRACRCERK